jgi:subtilisin family serine protease
MRLRHQVLPISLFSFALLGGCSPSPDAEVDAASAVTAASNNLAGAIPEQTARREAGPSVPQLTEYVPGELLVKFRDATNVANTSNSKRGLVLHSKRKFSSVAGLQLVRLADGVGVDEALTTLRAQGDVEYAEPNYIYRKQALPNDPFLSQQWGLDNTGQSQGTVDADIDAREAWDRNTGSSNTVVAVIDTGIDYTHPDLAPNIFNNPLECDGDGMDDDGNGYVDDCHGIDTTDGDSDPMDVDGHGTHVAGIIAARGNNGIGTTGVAWNTTLVACRFIGAQGAGDAASAIACLDYVAALRDRGVNIVATNNSWGGGVSSRALQDAIDRQRQRGILFVAAAGNAPSIAAEHNLGIGDYLFESGSIYPCAYPVPNVICVSASTRNDALEPYSYIGVHIGHVFAPGGDIYSTLPGGTYGMLSGTSMATPHVTGVIALLKSATPAMSWLEARNRVIAGGDYITRAPEYPDFGWPAISRKRINAAGAMTCANADILRRVAPRTAYPEGSYAIGTPIPISVMHINCTGPAGAVSATLNPGNLAIPLLDDGQGADEYAGDGVYSAAWTPQVAGAYTLTFPGLVMRDAGAGIGPDEFAINVDPYLERGFPVRMLQSPGANRSQPQTIVANLDGGADLEIVASPLMNGPTYAWKSNGTLAPGWPLERGGRLYYVGYFAAGNLDSDPATKEIVGTVADDGTTELSDPILGDPIEAYSASGQSLPCWPRATFNYMQQQPVTVDIDRDGIDETFFGGNDGYLRGVTHDCQGVPGAFISMSMLTGGQGVPTPIAGDLDADGRPELALYGGIYQPGQPNGLGLIDFASGSAVMRVVPQPAFTNPIAIGDVDGNGEMNIIATSSEVVSGNTVGVIRVLSPDGSTVRTIQYAQPGFGLNDAVLADLDQDGIPEIVISLSKFDSFYQLMQFEVTAVRGTGATMPGFPVTLKSGVPTITHVPTISPLAVGDVDGDLRPEIIANADGDLFAVNHDGSLASGTPHTLPNQFRFYTVLPDQPVIADIDADGRNEIVLMSTSWSGVMGYNKVLFVYDLRGPASHGPIEWGQAREGADRRAFYETGKNLATDAYLAILTSGDGYVTATGPGGQCQDHCLRRYARNATVQLTAQPSNGGTFDRWLGACAGQGATCTLNVSRYTTTRALFSRQKLTVAVTGPGSVRSNIPGIYCPSTCSAEYKADDIVTLTATPDSQATFMGWTGSTLCQVANPVCTLPMNIARSVSARFEYRQVLTIVISSGAGSGTVTSDFPGFSCSAEQCSQLFDYGTRIRLTLVPNGNRSARWSGGGCAESNPVCEVDMSIGHTVSADFPAPVRVTVSTSGSGSGTVTTSPTGINCGTTCTATFAAQTQLDFTATPAADSAFMGWSGGCDGPHFAAGPGHCYATMYGDFNLVATFALKLPLQVTREGGAGTVVSDVPGLDCGATCTGLYRPGQVVHLTAIASAENSFVGWSGACQGPSINGCTVTMDEAREVTAHFIPWNELVVTTQGGGAVTSSTGGLDCGTDCRERFAPNDVARLTATAAPQYTFDGWGGDCAGTSSGCALDMDRSRNVTARFVPWPELVISLGGAGTGSVSSSPLGISCGADCREQYAPNTSITLTASPGTGSEFTGWSGACTGAATTCTFILTAASTATANFRVTPPPPPPPPPPKNPGGGGGGGGGGRLDWLLLAFGGSLVFARMTRFRRTGQEK